MGLNPADFKDLTPEQVTVFLALQKNLQAFFFMKVILGLFFVVLVSALVAAFSHDAYAFSCILGIVDGTLGLIVYRIARDLFPAHSN